MSSESVFGEPSERLYFGRVIEEMLLSQFQSVRQRSRVL